MLRYVRQAGLCAMCVFTGAPAFAEEVFVYPGTLQRKQSVPPVTELTGDTPEARYIIEKTLPPAPLPEERHATPAFTASDTGGEAPQAEGADGGAVSPPAGVPAIDDAFRQEINARFPPSSPARLFYAERQYKPVWFESGIVLKEPDNFISMLEEAHAHALPPEAYNAAGLRRRRDKGDTGTAFEFALTENLLAYIKDVSGGRREPLEYYRLHNAGEENTDAPALLRALLLSPDPRIAKEHPAPDGTEYAQLQEALAFFRKIDAAGGFAFVPPGKTIRPGDSDPRVPLLRVRLDQEGITAADAGDMLPEAPGQAELYDFKLADAIVEFQRRRGLARDGVIGPATFAALNISAKALAEKISLNLERWRWLPDDLGNKHVRVNIAGYDVQAFENGSMQFDMKAVVGETYHETPMFSSVITEVIFLPYWYMPARLRREVYLPKIVNNPGYAYSKGYKLFNAAGGGWSPVDPYHIIPGADYRIRQDPGPQNALGKIKFPVKNDWAIYLHDTSSPHLFNKTARAFSSGCVRLEKPVRLAQFLLDGKPGYTPERIASLYHNYDDKRGHRRVPLDEPAPVHILYWTVWAEDNGAVHFRDDIYGRDEKLKSALEVL